jgi:hypothetical protein
MQTKNNVMEKKTDMKRDWIVWLFIIWLAILLFMLSSCSVKPVVHEPTGNEVYYGDLDETYSIWQSSQCPGVSRLVLTDQGYVFRVCGRNKFEKNDSVSVLIDVPDNGEISSAYLIVGNKKYVLE